MATHFLWVLYILTLLLVLCQYGLVLVGQQLILQVLTQHLLLAQLLFLLEQQLELLQH